MTAAAQRARLEKVKPIAEWWASVWGVPLSFVLAICEIESSFRPEAHNGAAVDQGGAWGLMQITATTAATLVPQLRRLNPPIRRVMDVLEHTWEASAPACLLDAELNVMLGAFYLGHFVKEFGARIDYVAVAYHNGAGFLRAFLRAGKRFPEQLPPKAFAYQRSAIAARLRHADEDKTPHPAPRVA